MKTKVNLGLKNISTSDKIQDARLYATNLDLYPLNFPNAHPTSALLFPAADNLETAYTNSQNGGINENAILHEKERIVDDLITELSHYMEDLPNCNPDLLHKLGMKERVYYKKKPNVFDVQQGEYTGKANLSAKKTNGAAYIWKIFKGATPPVTSINGDQGWNQLGISSRKATFIASGLEMEVKYWFTIASVIGQTIGEWETPLSIILV